jgi:hypothetical protein
MSALLVAGDHSRAEDRSGEPPILVNHLGFVPGAAKFCMIAERLPVEFSVVRSGSSRAEHHDRMKPMRGDLGDYLVGDFSALRTPGEYHIRIGSRFSVPFRIADNPYDDALKKSVAYFSKQRCGDSKTGYNAPCHLDDGRRTDNGLHHDATGGWHDACDVRKWVNATIYGMLGLLNVMDAPPHGCDPSQITEELRWGNQYFLKMQEPAGYLMDFCGGDTGNRFTDNNAGTDDDRPVQTRVCELPAQFHFVAAQARLLRHLRDTDPPYARTCESAARKCFAWCTRGRRNHTSTSLAAGILAAVEFHRTFADTAAADVATTLATQLLELQAADGPVKGFFFRSPDRAQPAREIMHGNLPLLALCELLEEFSSHRDASCWRDALASHAGCLKDLASRSAFGTIPFGLYYGEDPGGGRRIGQHWYRWFMKPRAENPSSPQWWVGINAHLASNGVGLARAARLLSSPSLTALAQRQLDWILGVNPFNASTVTAVGHNQPPLFITGEFTPVTPHIPGGVMNGLGGDANDQIVLLPGSYHTCEYWTPMVAYAISLLLSIG